MRAESPHPTQVEVDGRTISTRNIVIAAGASPLVPPIPGIEDDGLLDLRDAVVHSRTAAAGCWCSVADPSAAS